MTLRPLTFIPYDPHERPKPRKRKAMRIQAVSGPADSMTVVQRPLMFVPYDPSERPKAREAKTTRDDLKELIRGVFNAELCRLSGVNDAFMRYTMQGFATYIVDVLGLMFEGWLPDVPFMDISGIGGTRTLQRLLDAWNTKKLRLVRATDEQRRRAKGQPESVHPNPELLHISRAYEDSRKSATVVSPLVFHLADNMKPLGTHPTSTRPAVAGLGLSNIDSETDRRRRQRRQRRDTAKARARPVTNPDGHPLRHPKNGVKSSPFVIHSAERADGGSGDNSVHEVSSGGLSPERCDGATATSWVHTRDTSTMSCSHTGADAIASPSPRAGTGTGSYDWPVDDPLDEFKFDEYTTTSGATSEGDYLSEIESASGFDTCSTASDWEGLEVASEAGECDGE